MPTPRTAPVFLRPARMVWIGAVALAALTLGYLLVWWNSGVAFNSNGIGTLWGEKILEGKAPYRDFFVFVPPMQALYYAGIIALFGKALIFARAFAVIERVGIMVMLYFWLCRVFRPVPAFFGCFVAAVACCGDNAETLVHYNFYALFWAMAAGLLASFSTAPGILACGICAAMCLLAKQTIGVGVTFLFPVLIFFAVPARSLPARLRALLIYAAGWSIPIGLVGFWLWRKQALGAFFNATFLQGTSAKGSLGSILLRPLLVTRQSIVLSASLLCGLILVAVVMFILWKSRAAAPQKDAWPRERFSVVVPPCAVAVAAGVLAGWLPFVSHVPYRVSRICAFISETVIYATFAASGIMAVRYSVHAVLGKLSLRDAQVWALASLSFASAYMFSISWPAFEAMLIPGLAFLLAYVIQTLIDRGQVRSASVIAAACLGLVCFAACRKMIWPYVWENWTDPPVRLATSRSALPELRGLHLGPEAAKFLDHVTAVIDSHSRPDETIYVFPNLTMFYVLAHREPATFSYAHWFDITPDYIARMDSQRLMDHPPAVILFAQLAEIDISRLESGFRAGKASSQRQIIALIHKLAERQYQLVEKTNLPNSDVPLFIYARK